MKKGIQGAITTDLLVLGIALVILPAIMLILLPLIDNVLTEEVIEFINNQIDNIEFFLGSQNTNILFIIIAILLLMPIIRWIISFLNGNNIHDN